MSDEPASVSSPRRVSDEPHAPVIYFDATPACGHYNGVVGITLSADLARAVDGPEITVAHTVVAYLRTNLPGARALRESLDRAILLATPATGGHN
jgi:hypothetical protein